MKYFSYGMNTNKTEMAWRCPDAVSLGPVILPNYRFRFAYHADILENLGHDIIGVLWEITPNCLANLDLFEGYPRYYDRRQVKVIYQGQLVPAITYYMQPGIKDELPSEGYFNSLVEGYREHGISLHQLNDAVRVITDHR